MALTAHITFIMYELTKYTDSIYLNFCENSEADKQITKTFVMRNFKNPSSNPSTT